MPLVFVDNKGDLSKALAEADIANHFNLNLADAQIFGFPDDAFEFAPNIVSEFIIPEYFDTATDDDEAFFLVSKDHWVPYPEFTKNIMQVDVDKIIYGNRGRRLPSSYKYLEPVLKQVAEEIEDTYRGMGRAPNKGSCPFGCVCQYSSEQLKAKLSSWPYLRSLTTKYEMCAALRYIHGDSRFPIRISYPYLDKPAIIGILNYEPSVEAQQLARQCKLNEEIKKSKKLKKTPSKKQPPASPPHQAEALKKPKLEQSTSTTTLSTSAAQVAGKRVQTPVKLGLYGSPEPVHEPSPNYGRRRRRHYMRY